MEGEEVYVIKYNIEGGERRGDLKEYYSLENKDRFQNRYLELKDKSHISNISIFHGRLESIDLELINFL